MEDFEYKEIKKSASAIFKDRGSKFIAISYKVFNHNDIEEALENAKQEYHDARHHCYAYRINKTDYEEKFNDDGEPSGSAGRPIMGQIKSAEITNVLIVVIRYFGGTKLGVSGLINAYKTSAAECIKRSGVLNKKIYDYYSLKFEYPLMGDVMHIINKYNVNQHKTKFEISCEIIIKTATNESDSILSIFRKLHKLEIDYIKTE